MIIHIESAIRHVLAWLTGTPAPITVQDSTDRLLKYDEVEGAWEMANGTWALSKRIGDDQSQSHWSLVVIEIERQTGYKPADRSP